MDLRVATLARTCLLALVPALVAAAPPRAVAPFDTRQACAHQQAWAKHLGVAMEMTNSIGMKFVLIPPGEFDMGASDEEIRRHSDQYMSETPGDTSGNEVRRFSGEGPKHRVRISRPFYLGVCEVTQQEYVSVIGTNPSGPHNSGNTQRPVDRVTWYAAKEFCRQLTERPKEKAAGRVYDLPTEAEWEYACRAGTETEFPSGTDPANLDTQAWYATTARNFPDSKPYSHPVGEKKPNAWGLHDMLGNVWEWCDDWYLINYYNKSPAVDPIGPQFDPEKETSHVMRGGKYSDFLVWSSKRSCPADWHGFKENLRSKASGTRGFRITCRIEDVARMTADQPRVESPPPVGAVRRWTDASGKFTVEARLVTLQGTHIRLQATSGKTIDLGIDQLSQEDQEFLRTLHKPSRETTPPAGGWVELIGPDGPVGLQKIRDALACCADVRLDPQSKTLVPLPGEGVVAATTKLKGGGALNLRSKKGFGDCKVHLEFLIGQGANSGVKLQERYEIQLFDSHGKRQLSAKECGGIYPHWRFGGKGKGLVYIDEGVPPRVNAAKPAGQWQTLEIDFQAPRFDAAGQKKTENARFVSVVLNGTVIHENVDLDSPTGNTSTPLPETPIAPLFLQTDHGAVAFRNVRVRPLASDSAQ